MTLDLDFLKYPQRFHELCRDLMSAEYPRFQSYDGSGGDEGIDGYDPESETLFQFHYPRRGLRKDKLMKYLEAGEKTPHSALGSCHEPRPNSWSQSVARLYKIRIQIRDRVAGSRWQYTVL